MQTRQGKKKKLVCVFVTGNINQEREDEETWKKRGDVPWVQPGACCRVLGIEPQYGILSYFMPEKYQSRSGFQNRCRRVHRVLVRRSPKRWWLWPPHTKNMTSNKRLLWNGECRNRTGDLVHAKHSTNWANSPLLLCLRSNWSITN